MKVSWLVIPAMVLSCLIVPRGTWGQELSDGIESINGYFDSIKSYKMESTSVMESIVVPDRPFKSQLDISQGAQGLKFFARVTVTNLGGKESRIQDDNWDVYYDGKRRTARPSAKADLLQVTKERQLPSESIPGGIAPSVFWQVNGLEAEPGSPITVTTDASGQHYLNGKFKLLSHGEKIVDDVAVFYLEVEYVEGQGQIAISETYFARDLGYMPFGYKLFRQGALGAHNRVLKYQPVQVEDETINVPVEFELAGFIPPGSKNPKVTTLYSIHPESLEINTEIPDSEFESPHDVSKFYVFNRDLQLYISKPGAYNVPSLGLDDLLTLKSDPTAAAEADPDDFLLAQVSLPASRESLDTAVKKLPPVQVGNGQYSIRMGPSTFALAASFIGVCLVLIGLRLGILRKRRIG